jgi:hypothetical protein
MMRRIKHDTGSQVNPKPSQYFDMIGGCGFGGLVSFERRGTIRMTNRGVSLLAIMAGVLNMDGEQLVEEFARFCRIVFAPGLTQQARAHKMKDELRGVVRRYSKAHDPEQRMMSEDNSCKVYAGPLP